VPPNSMSTPVHIYSKLTSKQSTILLLSIMIVALCGIAYELIISTVSSYLLGNSSMGVGSYLSKLMGDNLIHNFIAVEIAISLVGGVCSLLLLMTFPYTRALYETVMFSLIFIIGALVGMEIPFLTGILSHRKRYVAGLLWRFNWFCCISTFAIATLGFDSFVFCSRFNQHTYCDNKRTLFQRLFTPTAVDDGDQPICAGHADFVRHFWYTLKQLCRKAFVL